MTPAILSRRAFLGRIAALVAASSSGIVPRPARAQLWAPFSLGILDPALGYSLIPQELKGDYAKGRRIADDALRDARAGGDAVQLADALRLAGVVRLLQGEAGAALELFDELTPLVGSDGERLLEAYTYGELAALLAFNSAPDGSTAEGDEIGVRQSSMWERISARSELGQQLPGSLATFASEYLAGACTALPLARDAGQHGRVYGGDMLSDAQGLVDRLWTTAQAFNDAGLLAVIAAATADAYGRAGDTDRAAELYEAAKQLYRQKGDLTGEGAVWLFEGDGYAAPLSSPMCRNYLIGVLAGADSGEAQAEAHELVASVDIERARGAYGAAETLFRRAGAPRALAALKLRASWLALLAGEETRAAALAREAAQDYEGCGDALGLWTARVHDALARIGAGESLEDRAVARTLAEWGAGPGSFSYALGLAHVCGRAGRHWMLRDGDYERALAGYRLAETAYVALGAGSHAAQSLVDQAGAYRAVGAHVLANESYHRSITAYDDVASANSALAVPALSRLLLASLDLWRNYEATRDAQGMQWAGEKMETAIDRARSLAPAEGSVEEISLPLQIEHARATLALSRVLVPCYRALEARDRGDATEAERFFQSALATLAAMSDGEQHDFLEAVVQAHRKDYASAQSAYERHFQATAKEGPAGSEGLYGQVLQALEALGDSDRRRMEVARAHERALAFYANIEAYGIAHEHLVALVALSGEDWWQHDEQPWASLSSVASVYAGLDRREDAARCLDVAIEELESRRERLHVEELKVGLASGSQQQWLYFEAASNALARARAASGTDAAGDLVAQAFRYAEQGKARALLDLMAGGLVGSRLDAESGAGFAAWRGANAKLTAMRGLLAAERGKAPPEETRIVYLTAQVAELEQELRELESGLARSNPGFYQVIDPQAAVLDAAQVGARLPEGTALLQYFFLGKELLAWAIDASGLVASHRAEVEAAQLARDIRALHSACEQHTPIGDVGGRLAQHLLAPFAAVLETHGDLIVVPYGAMHLLPFHALTWQGAPLAATHSLRYLPSASTLQFLGEAGEGRKDLVGILAVGNPARMSVQDVYGGPRQAAAPLPGAEVEARTVAASVSGGRALIGAAATADAVREALPSHRVVHFATHGVLSGSAPLLSSILLADGSALTVYELLGMRLQADLVVLSACRTGQGVVTRGDDVLGLTRGLLAAGAKAAVVSLWPVDDLATSLFMEHFYAELKVGAPAHRALQAAQNYLRGLDEGAIRAARMRIAQAQRGITIEPSSGEDGAYTHPYYWSPFILVA